MTDRLRRSLTALALVACWSALGAQEGTIGLGWDPVAHPELAGYRVFYWLEGANPDVVSTDVGPTTETEIQGLEDCQTYRLHVRAIDQAGFESAGPSNEVSGWARPRVEQLEGVAVPDAGTQVYSFDLTGANFQAGASVVFEDQGIQVQAVQDVDCNALQVEVELDFQTARGQLRFAVVNPDQVYGEGLLPVGFSIVQSVRRADRFEGFGSD